MKSRHVVIAIERMFETETPIKFSQPTSIDTTLNTLKLVISGIATARGRLGFFDATIQKIDDIVKLSTPPALQSGVKTRIS